MKIAFVGVKRKFQDIPESYRREFVKFHLELPYYFARDGNNEVTITTIDHDYTDLFDGEPLLHLAKENSLAHHHDRYDVVIHWRKFFPELYRPEAVNLVNCQDHSFSSEWKKDVTQAMAEGKLEGILCFPTWHKRNLHEETGISLDRLYDGVTLGVDTDIYKPAENKDPYQMLWASDPGRGLGHAILVAHKLFQRDRRFRLNICYPDYASALAIPTGHPCVKVHRSLSNGPELWNLFNTCGILPYTSCFKEPSSRAHRQAQAAGSMVVYPPGMGSPSELIDDDVDGIVAPVDDWVDLIIDSVKSGDWQRLGRNARAMAEREKWSVQADRFNRLIEKIRKIG